jgi:hypothetical protein
VGLALVTASAATSAITTCTGTLTGTYGSLTVQAGAECTLDGATVNGSVSVLGGEAALTVANGSTISGSLSAVSGTASVVVQDSTINGSVSLTGITGDGAKAFVCGSKVGHSVSVANSTGQIKIGDESSDGVLGAALVVDEVDCVGPAWVGGSVSFSNNHAEVLQLAGSHVGGSVSLSNNQPGPEEGEQDLAANWVGGSFSCSNNAVLFDPTDSDTGPLFDISGTTVVGSFHCPAPSGA